MAHEEPFTDRDISAFNPKKDRPAFNDMLKRVEAGEFGGVVVWKLDRLTRQLRQYATILSRIIDSNALLLSVMESIDTSTLLGLSMVGFIIGQAEQSSKDTSDRVKLSEDRRAEDGKPHGGGHRSYGYEWVGEPKKKKLVIVPEEAKIIKEIAKRMAAGTSAREITRWLNDEGIKSASGKTWSNGVVRDVIASPRLIGERVHHGKRIPSKEWEPILTEAEVNAALEAGDRGRGYRHSEKLVANQYLLSGNPTLIFCSNCGGAMYPVKRASQGKENIYKCRVDGSHCGHNILLKPTDEYVYLYAVEYSQNHQDPHDQGHDAEEALQAAETARDRLLADIATVRSEKWRTQDAEIRNTFDLTIDGMTNDLAQVRERISGLEIKASKRVSLIRGIGRPMKLTEMADRRAWLRLWVDKVWIDGAVRRGAGWGPARIRIEWTQGDYEPTDETDSDAGIDTWNALAAG